MSPASWSLVALIVALVVSMTSRINVGWLGLAFAWIIGVYVAGLRPDAVMAGFPVSLFITLTGVTLLFAIAEANGSLAALADRAIRAARGNVRVIPILFFVAAGVLSSIGPGAVSTVALLAPLAMIVGQQAGVSHFLTALMVANGANAGNLSPFSAVGVIANSAMAKAGLVGFEGRVWFANFAAHVLVGAAAYFWLAPRRRETTPAPAAAGIPAIAPRLKTIQHYFNEDMVRYYEPEDVTSLADAVVGLHRDTELRGRQARRAKDFLTDYGWERQGDELVAMYQTLVEN